MSILGDVVFCVDCDLARQTQAGAANGSVDVFAELPRRMAIKKDANGEPLCTVCLDSRQAKRRAEFMLHEGRGPSPGSQPPPASTAATSAAAPRRKVEFVRIMRSRPPADEVVVATKSGKKDAAQKSAAKRVTAERAPKPNGRGIERQFVMLAAEMGFLRAQQLLDGLKVSTRRVTGTGSGR